MTTVGIVGAGQLARMLALAGVPLGLRFVFLDPAQDACAAPLGRHLCGAYDDPALLAEMAACCDILTYEFENVPDAAIAALAERRKVFPDAGALSVSRDRLHEKTLFGALHIPTPPYAAIDSRADLDRALAKIGFPAVLKTRTLGYDGKGQAVLRSPADADLAWQNLAGRPLILEGFVAFEREVSIVAVRSSAGETAFYPLSENVHREGILRVSQACSDDACSALAQEYAARLLNHLDYVGVLALECFVVGESLLANEMAPRVHNSGHWTIEGAETSQFENHLRAGLGLPLGATRTLGEAAMVNFIGNLPDTAAVLAIPGAHLHLYGKSARAGRKVAHASLRCPDAQSLAKGLAALSSLAGD